MPRAVPKPGNRKTGNKGIGGGKGNSNKRSGTYFEDTVADHFDSLEGVTAKRVMGSGAFGTISNEPRLMGDVYMRWDYLDRPILAECKFGYGGKTQLTVKKEWIDKIVEEARQADRHAALVFKFKGARGPNSKVIAFTWETWEAIMDSFRDTVEHLEGVIDEFERSEGWSS
jgi:hypothetical protein